MDGGYSDYKLKLNSFGGATEGIAAIRTGISDQAKNPIKKALAMQQMDMNMQSALLSEHKNAISGILGTLSSVVTSGGSMMGLKKGLAQIKSKLGGLQDIKDKALNEAKDKVGNAKNILRNKLQDAKNNVDDEVNTPDQEGFDSDNLLGRLTQRGRDLVSKAQESVSDAAQRAQSSVSDATQRAQSSVSDAAQRAQESVSDVARRGQDSIENVNRITTGPKPDETDESLIVRGTPSEPGIEMQDLSTPVEESEEQIPNTLNFRPQEVNYEDNINYYSQGLENKLRRLDSIYGSNRANDYNLRTLAEPDDPQIGPPKISDVAQSAEDAETGARSLIEDSEQAIQDTLTTPESLLTKGSQLLTNGTKITDDLIDAGEGAEDVAEAAGEATAGVLAGISESIPIIGQGLGALIGIGTSIYSAIEGGQEKALQEANIKAQTSAIATEKAAATKALSGLDFSSGVVAPELSSLKSQPMSGIF